MSTIGTKGKCIIFCAYSSRINASGEILQKKFHYNLWQIKDTTCICRSQLFTILWNIHTRMIRNIKFMHDMSWHEKWLYYEKKRKKYVKHLLSITISFFSLLFPHIFVTGCKSCGNTFHTLNIKFHRRHTSTLSIILATWYAIWGHRCQKGSDIMCKAIGIYLWTCRNITNRTATYDSKSWLFSDFIYASTLIAWSSYAWCARIIFESDKISRHMSIGQQRFAAQTGKVILCEFLPTIYIIFSNRTF